MDYPVWDSGNGFYIDFEENIKAINCDYIRQSVSICRSNGLDVKQLYPSLVDSFGEDKWHSVAFPYGLLSLAAATSDFNRVQKLMGVAVEKDSRMNAAASRLRYLIQNGMDTEYGLCREIAHPIAKIVAMCLEGLYLDVRQRAACFYMLRDGTADRIMNDPALLDSPYECLPEIYQQKELHRCIQSVMLRKPDAFDSPLLERINFNIIPCSHFIMSGGLTMTVYYPASLMDFLTLDISRFLQTRRIVKRCKCCERLFIPSRKSDKYCRLPNTGTRLKCKEIAHRNGGDEFDREKAKARGYQRGSVMNESVIKKYDPDFLRSLYDEWSAECSKKCMECKLHSDIQGFKKWIQESKLTADVVKQRYEQRQNTAEE